MSKENKEQKGRGFYEHRPIRDFKASVSKDGKFWVFKDITTHIVPRSYLSKIEVDFIKEQNESSISSNVSDDRKVEQGNA